MRHHHQLSPQSIRFCPLCGGGLERRGRAARGQARDGLRRLLLHLLSESQGRGRAPSPKHDGRILLTRRTIQPARGKWTFPGGFVDWGEPVEDGAVRETWEETGLTVDLGGLLGVYSYAGTPIVIVVYRARVVGGEIRTCSENDRVEWVDAAEIPWDELAFPSTEAALRDLLSGRLR